ncbi:MAG: DNA translocase FtsK 4TM domain-containing protein, partial [Planctomycetaceae bacterium]|nr:DNA translocase FtsK 4TM domain-containing protein [Planctomycetaceae bacterium]
MEHQIFILRRLGAVALISLGLFLLVSMLSHSPLDPPDSLEFPASVTYQNWCGKIGAVTASRLFNLFGYAAYIFFLPVLGGIFACFFGKKPDQIFLRITGFLLILLGSCGLAVTSFGPHSPGPVIGPGGYLGVTVHACLKSFFAAAGSTILYTSFLLSGILLGCDYTLLRLFCWMFGIQPLGDFIVNFFRKSSPQPLSKPADVTTGGAVTRGKKFSPQRSYRPEPTLQKPEDLSVDNFDDFKSDTDREEEEIEDNEELGEKKLPPPVELIHETRKQILVKGRSKNPLFSEEIRKIVPSVETFEEGEESEAGEVVEDIVEDYELPPMESLVEPAPLNHEEQERTAQRQAKLLEKAFADYGFNIKVIDIQTGPVISQFELDLERGLRLKKVASLTDDLAVTLRVPHVRFVPSIPGKNTVGIELPNANRQLVRLREVMEATLDKTQNMAIPVFLGKDASGNPMVIDLAKMPHLLIAGRTGTGKSVCLNSIIVSILMTRRPEECRMIMIDPKMVELSPYQTIPHLMHPVVTDMKKAEAILGWAVDKMEQRYQILSRAGVRQLSEYNKLSEEELYRRINPVSDEEWETFPKSLPYTVIVADEMADLMMTAAKEVETHIIRIAQKSRAVGIHLVLATQKPTVDIITGLIKSNLPARIAFGVASRTDSQVILDQTGAEKLLGNGDMLFLHPSTNSVVRGQGTFVSDEEINSIIELVGTDHPDFITELVELQTEEDAAAATDERDELYNEVVEFVLRQGNASASSIQRKFKIGYNRAGRLVDFMSEDGIVGAPNGSKKRDVLITLHEWRKRLASAIEDKTESLPPPVTVRTKPVLVQPVKPVPVPVSPVTAPKYAERNKYGGDINEDVHRKETVCEESVEKAILPMVNYEEKDILDDSSEYEYEYVYEDWDGDEDEGDEYEYVEYETDDE